MKRYLVVTALVVVVFLVAWTRFRKREVDAANGRTLPSSSVVEAEPGGAAGAASASAGAAGRYPRAARDQAKRDELRARILAAAAEGEANARAEAEAARAAAAAAGSAPPARGQRQTDDVKEFGKFVTQAIQEDFIPMARSCAKELVARKPGASGTAKIDFELLGDSKIGGVVNSADIDPKKSTVHDEKFETCVRESLYGVYFDPPPSSGRATLNFDVTIFDDGGLDEEVPEYNIRDRRNEK